MFKFLQKPSKPTKKRVKKGRRVWGFRAKKPIREPVVKGSATISAKPAPKRQKSIVNRKKPVKKKKATTPADVVKRMSRKR